MEPNQINWYIIHIINGLLPYAIAAVGVTFLSITPIGRAVISWLKGHVNRGRAAELAGDIDRLRQELLETQERLDFAERHLASTAAQAPPALKPGHPGAAEPRIPTPV